MTDKDADGNATQSSRVNSYDEWSPLKEVIVGSPISYDMNEMDLSFKLFYNDNAFMSFGYPSYQKKSHTCPDQTMAKKAAINKRLVEELTEDVDGLVATLEKLDIKVFRPGVLSKSVEFTTPYWKATGIPALNVRDQAIILGDEILETPPQIRARYFENDLMKSTFYHYFANGSKWTCMPKAIMTDNSFDLSYVKSVNRDMIATEAIYEQNPSDYDIGLEMMIDGAQCLRFGRDILVNVSTVNHELGFQWMQRHLGSKFRLHKLHRLSDSHIDSILLPLRPGKLLLRDPKYLTQLPEALQKWDIILPPEPDSNNFPDYAGDDLLLASKYIDLNVLSIDEERVVVNSLCPEFMKTLEKHGFTPIPVQHRHRRIFGGGFHCFTLDTVRDGSLEDYF